MDKIGVLVMATAIRKKYSDQIQACLDTWVRDAEKNKIRVIFFAGYHYDKRFPLVNLPGVKEDYNSALDKQFHGLKWMYDKDPCDFYMVVGTDTYININNLKELLKKYDKTEDLYIGGHSRHRKIDHEVLCFHSGGAGFIVTHNVLKRLYGMYEPKQIYDLWSKICKRNGKLNLLPGCDLTMAYLCDMMLIKPSIEKHFYGCNLKGRCHGDRDFCDNCKDTLTDPSKIISCHLMDPPYMHEYHNYIHCASMEEIIPDWTVVTSFYHLPRYGNDFNRSIEYYLKAGFFVLSLPVNLVIYCDKEEYEYMYNYRKEKGWEKHTKIIVKSLKDYKMYAYIDKIKQNRIGNPTYLNHRNTPTYSALVVSKFDMVNQAIDNNYFNTDFFAWIDFGLSHAVGNYPNQVIRALNQYREKVSMAYIVHLPKNLVFNNAKYYKGDGLCCVAAGFITGHKRYIHMTFEACLQNYIDVVNEGYGHAEQNVVPVVYYNHKNWFDFYFADYQQILNNYDQIRGGSDIIIDEVINKSFANDDHDICYSACEKLFDSIFHLNLDVNLDKLTRIIDRYYVSAFYTGKREKCVEILQLYDKFIELYGKEFEDRLNPLLDHIINNADHIYDIIKDLTPAGNISVEGNISEQEINELIKQEYKIFIYGDYKLSTKSLIVHNPVYRPLNRKFNTRYVKEIKPVGPVDPIGSGKFVQPFQTTLVTGFLDVANIDPKFTNRSVQKYIEFGIKLVNVPINKIVFLPAKMIKLMPTNQYTIYVPFNHDQMWLWKHYEQIKKIPLGMKNNKDCHGYMMVQLQKTDWIKRAIELNFYPSSVNYMWCDFGIFHISKNDLDFSRAICNFANYNGDKVKIPGCYTHDSRNITQQFLIQNPCWVFCGGALIGPKKKILLFDQYIKEKTLQLIKENIFMWEINVWFLVFKEHQELIKWVYGLHDITIFNTEN